MPILSAQLLFSEAQAITGDAASTNIIDLGATGTPHGAAAALTRDIGKGQPVPIDLYVTAAFNNLTSLDVSLEVDDNSSFSSATVVQTQNILLADLAAAGQKLSNLYLPEGVNERYVRLNYNVNGTNPSTGAITAGITGGRQTNIVA